jgi:hypothetical protein
MPISISCSVPALNAQKGRKLLLPLGITLFAPIVPIGDQCRVYVSFISSNAAAGVFSIPVVPGLWEPASTSPGAVATVRSATSFDPHVSLPPFTAFPAFFDPVSVGTPRIGYVANYQVEVYDTSVNPPVLQGSVPVTVSGDAAAVAAVNVVFALDRGSSMSTPDSSGVSRLDRLKAAFPVGVGLLRDTDILAVSSFANARVDPPLNPSLGPAQAGSMPMPGLTQRDLAIDLANKLVQDTTLPPKIIQRGINAAHTLSPGATLVLVTDGQSAGAITPPTSPTSVLVIGENPALLPPAVPLIVPAGSHYAFPSPALGQFGMEKLLTEVLVCLGGTVSISDPEGSLEPGGTQSFPLHLTEADHELQVIIFSNDAHALDVQVLDVQVAKPPSHGEKHDCAPEDDAIRGPGFLIRRLPLRALRPLDREDRPVVVVSRPIRTRQRDTAPPPPVRFNLIVVAKTDLMLDAEVTASGLTVGSDLLFSAVLREYGQTWDRPGVSVRVELFHPDGGVQMLDLDKTAPGRFQTSLRSFRTGAYTARFILTGTSLLQKRACRRECLRTVAVFPTSQCCPPSEYSPPSEHCPPESPYTLPDAEA